VTHVNETAWRRWMISACRHHNQEINSGVAANVEPILQERGEVK